MASAVGVHVSLDSSALPSCSLFRPASFQHGVVKAGGRSRAMKCCCSREEESGPSFPRRKAFGALVATGLALAISTNTAIADGVPKLPGADNEIVKSGADKLNKEADKLINKVPSVRAPTFEGVPEEDAGRLTRKAGSGLIDDLQDAGSKLVGDAREANKQRGDEFRERLDESVAKTQNKTDDAKKGLQEFFGQAKDKVTGGAEKLKEGSGDLVGDARNKVGSEIGNTKNKVGGSIYNGKGGLISDAQSNIESAKNKAGSSIDNGMKDPAGKAKELVSDARSKMDNGMKDPAGKAKELVSDARSKAGGAAENARDNANDLVGSIKKGLRIQ